MKLILIILLFTSCSQVEQLNKRTFCDYKSKSIQSKHLIMMANSQQNKLMRCFKNYLRFESNKKQQITVCNTLNVKRSGKVSYAKVFGPKVPKDLAMCLEQELWIMNFSPLQLDNNIYVQYPLTFKSI